MEGKLFSNFILLFLKKVINVIYLGVLCCRITFINCFSLLHNTFNLFLCDKFFDQFNLASLNVFIDQFIPQP